MALQTDLSRSPYFDDYDTNKNFYKILYRPSVAVQARELNQMQTILQDQIDKFGRHVFKEGSVIEGCSFTFDDNYNYVKIKDSYANGSTFTIVDFIGQTVTTTTGLTTNSNLQAIIVNAVQGYESQDPDLNTLYIKYLNTGTYSNGSSKTYFSNSDNLYITTSSNVAIGNVTVAAVNNSSGKGYAFTTTAGIIFKKGFFINVQPNTYIISKYDSAPDGISVGFDAVETIVTPEADSSLYDNAAGAPNFAAPGAHRLQLIPNLVIRSSSDTSNSSSFFSLVDFKSGKPVSIKNDPQYAQLGAALAQRTFETNGNYVVYPFVLSTESKATDDTLYSNYVNLVSTRGLGYVEGYRVEYVNNNKIDLRRSTDYETVNSQVTTANFGYYVYVKSYAGEFNTDSLLQVELHSTAKQAVTGGSFLSVGYTASTKIGTAYIRGFSYASGTIGSGSELYRAYLFNVQMNPGANFRQVKSIISYQSSAIAGVADVILTYDAQSGANVAILQNSFFNNMIYPFGQKALKTNGFSSTQYVYRNKANSSFSTLATGSMTITLPASPVGSATETFNITGTPISASQTQSFLVVPTATGYSNNKTGTVAASSSGNTITGTSTTFLADYMVGDYISINGETKQITLISNNTSMTTLQNFTTSPAANVHAKAFPAGVPIDFTKSSSTGSIVRSISVTGTTATITLGEKIGTSFNALVYFDTLRASTVSIKKNIKKNVYVCINCASHSTGTLGPYSLGFPDVNKIRSIYLGQSGTFVNTGVDYTGSFKFDNGQRDSHYDLATITPTSATITANTRITVVLDVFTYDQSQGVGFFTANSYPIDDANTSNTTAITTSTIPVYTATDGSVFDLRDSVDFRPFASNTIPSGANSTNWTTTANASGNVNPSGLLTFSVLATGTYLPTPDSNFQTNIQHYLKRIDKAIIKTSGEFSILEGAPSNKPVPPPDQSGSMTIGVVNIPEYPSLSTPEAKATGRYDYAITNTITQIKRYTMKDIGSLSNKIDNLEYYTSLSLLEKQASDTLVRSGTSGQNRFQNGILVDPFRGHDISNTQDPNYYIAIDENRTELRPAFQQFRRPLNYSNGTGVVKIGDIILLNHTTRENYIQQAFASKYRNCIDGNIFVFKGNVKFDPAGDTNPDLNSQVDIPVNIDNSANFAALPMAYGTQWGNWNTTSQSSSVVGQSTGQTSVTDQYGNIINTTTTQTATSTAVNQQRIGQQLTMGKTTTSYPVGNFVTDVSIMPYIKSIAVRVYVTGMKKNTRVWAFMNNIDVNAWIRPANADFSAVGNLGDSLYTNDDGNLYAVYVIPPNTFKSTSLEMKFVDVSNPVTGADAITTTALGTFYGSNISMAKGNVTLNAIEPTFSLTQVSQEQTITNITTDVQSSVVVIPAPIPDIPDYYSPADSTGTGCCFDPNAKVLMKDGTWKKISEVKVGDQVMGVDHTVNNVVGTKTTIVADRKMIKIDGYDFYSTDDHLFLTNNGWKTWRPDRLIDNNRDNAIFLEGKNRFVPLNYQDILVMHDGYAHYSDLKIEEHDFDSEYILHDLHLDGNQSYIIEGFIVHNCGGGGCDGGTC